MALVVLPGLVASVSPSLTYAACPQCTKKLQPRNEQTMTCLTCHIVQDRAEVTPRWRIQLTIHDHQKTYLATLFGANGDRLMGVSAPTFAMWRQDLAPYFPQPGQLDAAIHRALSSWIAGALYLLAIELQPRVQRQLQAHLTRTNSTLLGWRHLEAVLHKNHFVVSNLTRQTALAAPLMDLLRARLTPPATAGPGALQQDLCLPSTTPDPQASPIQAPAHQIPHTRSAHTPQVPSQAGLTSQCLDLPVALGVHMDHELDSTILGPSDHGQGPSHDHDASNPAPWMALSPALDQASATTAARSKRSGLEPRGANRGPFTAVPISVQSYALPASSSPPLEHEAATRLPSPPPLSQADSLETDTRVENDSSSPLPPATDARDIDPRESPLAPPTPSSMPVSGTQTASCEEATTSRKPERRHSPLKATKTKTGLCRQTPRFVVAPSPAPSQPQPERAGRVQLMAGNAATSTPLPAASPRSRRSRLDSTTTASDKVAQPATKTEIEPSPDATRTLGRQNEREPPPSPTPPKDHALDVALGAVPSTPALVGLWRPAAAVVTETPQLFGCRPAREDALVSASPSLECAQRAAGPHSGRPSAASSDLANALPIESSLSPSTQNPMLQLHFDTQPPEVSSRYDALHAAALELEGLEDVLNDHPDSTQPSPSFKADSGRTTRDMGTQTGISAEDFDALWTASPESEREEILAYRVTTTKTGDLTTEYLVQRASEEARWEPECSLSRAAMMLHADKLAASRADLVERQRQLQGPPTSHMRIASGPTRKEIETAASNTHASKAGLDADDTIESDTPRAAQQTIKRIKPAVEGFDGAGGKELGAVTGTCLWRRCGSAEAWELPVGKMEDFVHRLKRRLRRSHRLDRASVQDLVRQTLRGNVDEQDELGRTALMHICALGASRVLKYLLQDYSPNLLLRDCDGATVLSHAAMSGRRKHRLQLAIALLRYGAPAQVEALLQTSHFQGRTGAAMVAAIVEMGRSRYSEDADYLVYLLRQQLPPPPRPTSPHTLALKDTGEALERGTTAKKQAEAEAWAERLSSAFADDCMDQGFVFAADPLDAAEPRGVDAMDDDAYAQYMRTYLNARVFGEHRHHHASTSAFDATEEEVAAERARRARLAEEASARILREQVEETARKRMRTRSNDVVEYAVRADAFFDQLQQRLIAQDDQSAPADSDATPTLLVFGNVPWLGEDRIAATARILGGLEAPAASTVPPAKTTKVMNADKGEPGDETARARAAVAAEATQRRKVLRLAQKRWHPDRWEKYLPLFAAEEQERVREGVKATAQLLNALVEDLS
ncbi:uncharacterized protein MONBRDRAFT_27162 [Monosiga brevicollis MX1]|uniref:Replication factor A C-terminal domain-containing protein n=1 Tax=Monosiga brevicollis TaxID=81824 RepID=A9V4H6_MONBE|nr:uncharacterized protein MONBRDRAFT_27162 [Monosiga brevicollis MX1]EDQ87616.1 predicted protein [Monosiga brevicollis MX1]|eukprot:XP_001747536.1 hypothetical protein [Monosiga brevicollis MX1]